MNAEIDALLGRVSYGTLALCGDGKPYSLPINFVMMDGNIYFHGSKKGRKITLLHRNPFASFSVVEPYALIPSYFSSCEGLACPATHFFTSVLIEGEVVFVDAYEEKQNALEALMQKLQPEGGYKAFHKSVYQKAINATEVFKLIPEKRSFKQKSGQHLPKERFEMILSHLEKRGRSLDMKTAEMMQRSL